MAASSERITATADTTTNSLIVTAPAVEMQRVEQIVREIDTPDALGKITKYYPLTSAEPIPMSRALAESHPKAKFSSDSVNGGIYITG
ncbi:MAG: secretin N-terminal domain-containing protein, partial [Pirellula sp.]